MTAPPERFHVAGVLVQAFPAQVGNVRERIGLLEGAVVHAADDAGRLVVTIESADLAAISHQLTTLQSMHGVVSAVLVSEHSESLSGDDGADPP